MEQLSEVSPRVSVWFWGHEHRLAFYKPQAYGVPCARMLGNSAFQIKKDNYYKVEYPDYNAVIPRFGVGTNRDGYYHHTGALATHTA